MKVNPGKECIMQEDEFEFADFDLTSMDWNGRSNVRNNFIVASLGQSSDNDRAS
jgi:hypothetical protein